MFDISVLYVWNCLELARDNKHPYGGDITEIYAQYFVPNKPVEDQWEYAGRALYVLLQRFCLVNEVNISIDGRAIGDWMNNYKFFHKCDVRIF